MLKRLLVLFLFILLFNKNFYAQCGISVTSSNGWTANITYSVTGVVLTGGSPYQWYYKYGAIVSYSLTFTGSTTSRSVTLQNMCVSCIAGSGACTNCTSTIGTFNSNTTGTVTINNNNCEYDAVSSYNYGSNPSYLTLNITNAACTSAQVDVSGNGISYTSGIQCLSISPTPIELLSFGLEPNKNSVDVTWVTLTEANNNYFTIEKSTDGENFTQVATVNSKAFKGNSTQALTYNFTDNNPYNGTSYYRLKQTDYNSSYKYFNMVPVTYSLPLNVAIYPNPAQNAFSIEPNTTQKQTLQLFDVNNTLVLSQTISGKTSIDVGNLSQGVYSLNVSNNLGAVNKKLVIVK